MFFCVMRGMFLGLKAIAITLIVACVTPMHAITTPTRCNFEKDMCGFTNIGYGTWKIGNGNGNGSVLEVTTTSVKHFRVTKRFTSPMCHVTFRFYKYINRSIEFSAVMKLGHMIVITDYNEIWYSKETNNVEWRTVGRKEISPFHKLSLVVLSGNSRSDQIYAFDDVIVYPCPPCKVNPCQHGGTCTDDGGDFTCKCTASYTGTRCERKSSCTSDPCYNGGTCTEVPDGFKCACTSAYEGTQCADVKNFCSTSTCLNGGTCIPYLGDFGCSCKGYDGHRCEKDIDECKSSPCQHGGTCHNTPGSYKCICSHGYIGLHCDTPTTTYMSTSSPTTGEGISNFTAALSLSPLSTAMSINSSLGLGSTFAPWSTSVTSSEETTSTLTTQTSTPTTQTSTPTISHDSTFLVISSSTESSLSSTNAIFSSTTAFPHPVSHSSTFANSTSTHVTRAPLSRFPSSASSVSTPKAATTRGSLPYKSTTTRQHPHNVFNLNIKANCGLMCVFGFTSR